MPVTPEYYAQAVQDTDRVINLLEDFLSPSQFADYCLPNAKFRAELDKQALHQHPEYIVLAERYTDRMLFRNFELMGIRCYDKDSYYLLIRKGYSRQARLANSSAKVL